MTGDENIDAIHMSTLRNPSEWGSADFIRRWNERLSSSQHINSLYASPEWLECLSEITPAGDLAAVVLENQGGLVGIVPVRKHRFRLPYDVASHALFKASFDAVEILGSVPMIPDGAPVLSSLFRKIEEIWPGTRAIYFDTVPADTPWHRYLSQLSGERFSYAIDGRRPWFLLDLPSSREDYLASLGSKTRSTR